MLLKIDLQQLWNVKRVQPAPEARPVQPAAETLCSAEMSSQDELRRRMYERIAQGNALADAEDHARRTWHGRDEA